MALHTKKLYYRRGGTTYSIDLYTTTVEVGSEYLTLRDGTTNVYAKIDAVGSANESYLRVRKSGATKSILSTILAPGMAALVNYDISNSSSYPGSGTIVYDIGTANVDGSLVNGVGYASNNSGVLTFDGIDDYVMLASETSINLSAGSVLIWWKPTSWSPSGSGEYFWCCGGTPQSGGTFNWLGAHPVYSTNLSFGVFHPQGHRIAAHTSAPTPGVWHHVVASWGAFGIKIAVNGYFTGNNSNASFQIYKDDITMTAEYLGVGGNPSTGSPCAIGSFKIVDRALTDAEVLAEFNTTKARFGL